MLFVTNISMSTSIPSERKWFSTISSYNVNYMNVTITKNNGLEKKVVDELRSLTS